METWLVPVEGWFVDRFGPRIVVMFGGIVVAIAWTLNSMASSLPMLYRGAVLSRRRRGRRLWHLRRQRAQVVRRPPRPGGRPHGRGLRRRRRGDGLSDHPRHQTYGYQRAFLWFGLGQGLVILVLSQFLQSAEGRRGAEGGAQAQPELARLHAGGDGADADLLDPLRRCSCWWRRAASS